MARTPDPQLAFLGPKLLGRDQLLSDLAGSAHVAVHLACSEYLELRCKGEGYPPDIKRK